MDSRSSSIAKLSVLCITGLLLISMPKGTYGNASSSLETNDTIWDSADTIELLESKRLTQHLFNCLMDTGRCLLYMEDVKGFIIESVATECAHCTPKEKQFASKVIRYLREFESEKYTMLVNKYDPDGTYRRKYQAYL